MAYRPSRRLVASTVIILFVIVAFIVILPEIGRRAAVNRLERVFTVPVAIGDVDANLFTGRARIENLVIGNNEPSPILRLPAATIEFSRTALLRGRIDLAAVVLRNPELLVERRAPDDYNIIQAVGSDKAAREDQNGGIAFSISRLQIESGQIVFVDRTQEPDYRLTLSSLNFAAGPISTLPQARATPTSFSAGIRIGDGSIRVAGSTQQPRQPQMVQLTAEISDVALQVFHVYLPYGGRLNVKDSVLNGQARYVITKNDENTVEHYLDAELRVGGAGLMSAPPERPILQVAGLAARGIHVDFLANRAVVGALAIAEPYLLVARDAAGFNFQQFSPIREAAGVKTGGREDTADKTMSLTIERVETENGAVEFIDQTVTPSVNSRFQKLRLVAHELQVSPNFAAAEIEAEARLDNGSLRVTGNLSDQSSAGQFAIAGAKLPFQPFRGYLDQLFSSATSSGERLSGELKLVFDPKKPGGVAITGKLQGEAMALRFPGQQNPFLTTQRLGVDLRSIRVGSNPRVDIDEIKFTGANLSIVRNQDGSLNLNRLWAARDKQRTEPAQQERASATARGATVAVRLITVDQSDIGIVDTSVSPNYGTRLSRVSGKLTDLRPKARRAELKVQGVLGDSANLSLSGWFIPFSREPNMYLEGTIRSYALPPLNPYATQYVSHRIRRGQITMDVKYTLEEGQVDAAADVVLRQVQVGERTGDEFINRIGIPLELAVALLEDINGVIRLQLAMRGDTGLELDVARLVWNAVRNAIMRAITAPFRLVGNILTLGGRIGGVRIDPIRFEPGTQEIQAKSAEQLNGLTELLKEKPKLEFNVVGAASRAEIDALKQKQFWQMIDATGVKGYQTALIQLYRKMGGITKPTTPLAPIAEESMERFVLERIKVGEEELRELARRRAEIVKEQLVRRGVEPQRLAAVARDRVTDDTEAAVEFELVS